MFDYDQSPLEAHQTEGSHERAGGDEMTMEEAIKRRHTVRKYSDRKLSLEIIDQLNVRIRENNDKYGLKMRLVTDNVGILSPFIRLLLTKGVRNYIVLAGDDTADVDERLGYCGADLILFAQTLGLNSWWIGGLFNRKAARENARASEAEKITGVIILGYGATQGVPHQSKRSEDISSYQGAAPEWFVKGVQAVLSAPTANNRQAFTITGDGQRMALTCDNGVYSGTDLGIGRYHFEAGEGKDNFEWI